MRKFWLGIAFLVAASFIGYAGIVNHSDLVGLATVVGAMAAGTFSIVWGNAQEWKAKASNGNSK